jgi:glycosyltransferase involved in cell wall biosynthesis
VDGISVTVVVPAFNEERVIGDVVRGARSVLGDDAEVVVVDDGSRDATARIAADAGARVLRQPYNIGNGAAVKAGIRAARGRRIVLMDGDGQHPWEAIPSLLEQLEQYEMAVGSRTAASETDLHRNLANRFYNRLASYICGRRILDLTSGFRAANARALKRFVYLLPNTFSYPSTLTLSMSRAGLPVTFVPVKIRRRVGKSKIKLLRDGTRFLLIILRIATLYAPMRVFLPVSLLFLLGGLGNYAYTYLTAGRFTNMSALLLINAVMIFLLSLIAEQIANLRMERSEIDPASPHDE